MDPLLDETLDGHGISVDQKVSVTPPNTLIGSPG